MVLMRLIFYLSIVVFVFSGCDIRQREAALEKRTAEITEREQHLLLRAESLYAREQVIIEKEKQLDSTLSGTRAVYNPALEGRWSVRMVCTETTCTGSAVGDTKNEVWVFSYDDNRIVAKATASDQLVRIYSGGYNNNILEMASDVEATAGAPATKMLLRLDMTDSTTMKGQREIVRPDCRIIYSLNLDKS